MKKIALTSLLAVFVASGANAANVINDNPLYRPEQGRFYSITSLSSHTENTKVAALDEEFGYGLTDHLSVAISASVSESDWFDTASWDEASVMLNYRALDMGNWKGDIYAGYGVLPVWGDHETFLDKDLTDYGWLVGARAGYATDAWTVAGHVNFMYLNTESFNWNDEGIHTLAAGVDGQLVLNKYWNLVAGAEYTTILDDKIGGVKVEHPGSWAAKFGANLNIDETKFVGAYITKEMEHTEAGKWEVVDGFGFGVKVGIDF